MNNYKKFFKDKKITVMGLGLLGRGLGYTKFLAEHGAVLTVTDLKTKKELTASLKELEKFPNITYVLGEHRLEDFQNKDMIMKSAGVPLESIYIKEAKKNDIPVEMDVSLFLKLAPKIKVIGVTGTRGKSMTTALIYHILSSSLKELKNKKKVGNIFLGGNVRGVATLPLLSQIKEKDVLVCELDSWQLQGFGDAQISPQIAVFTSFMQDHMNYYKHSMTNYFKDKSNIFKFQKKNDVLIIRPDVFRFLPKELEGKLEIINPKDVADYNFIVPGIHQRENLACAVAVAKLFKIPISKIEKYVAEFKGLEGRLELLKTYKGVEIYNDNNATTPEATISGIKALSVVSFKNKPKIILICGGSDKKLFLPKFIKIINKNCKLILTIPGTGTDRLLEDKNTQNAKFHKTKDLKEAVEKAIQGAVVGDIILFSPAFASFGTFANEYERNDLFVKLVKNLK